MLAALLALVAAGCGGGEEASEEVPADAVAVVGEKTIARAEFERLMEQARRGFRAQKRSFPKPGTPEYEALKQQALTFLIQRAQFEQEAEELGVEVQEEEVEKRLQQVKKQYFGGNENRYRTQLKAQGLTEEQVKRDLESQLLSEKIFAEVTKEVEVTEADVRRYYERNRSQYEQPESRDVRHILVKDKQTAERLYRQLQDGGDFAALARRFSQDPGSKSQGGKLTIARGQTVATFDQTAFLLDQGQISRPVRTQYGYHIIEPLSAIKPSKTTPLSQVKGQIRQQLLQSKKQERINDWVEETKRKYRAETRYAAGYAPRTTTGTARTSS